MSPVAAAVIYASRGLQHGRAQGGGGLGRRMDKKDSSEKTAVTRIVWQCGSEAAWQPKSQQPVAGVNRMRPATGVGSGCQGRRLAVKGGGEECGRGTIGLAVSVIGSVGCVTLRAAKRSERNQEKNE